MSRWTTVASASGSTRPPGAPQKVEDTATGSGVASTRSVSVRRYNGDNMPSERVDKKLGVSVDVLKLGLVSLLTDVSSEMIFSVFAVFFTTIAGS